MSQQSLRYAYNTNGCAHHRLDDAVGLIADAGYDGVALTLDWHHLDPLAEDWSMQTHRLAKRLRSLNLDSVIETGARYLLNPSQKHEPTLINPAADERRRRIGFLQRAVDIAAILGAETVSFWAGIKQAELADSDAWRYLLEGIEKVVAYATRAGVEVSLEPEPGMLVETNADYDRLLSASSGLQNALHLALDLGHVWVTGEAEPAAAIHRYGHRLGTVSIEGMNRGVHLHLPLTEGDMEIPPLLTALREISFSRLVCVELSRESPRAHLAIPESIEYLRKAEASLTVR